MFGIFSFIYVYILITLKNVDNWMIDFILYIS